MTLAKSMEQRGMLRYQPTVRLLRLLLLLSDGFEHDSRDIQAIFGVSKRTVIRLSIALEDAGFALARGLRDTDKSAVRTYRLVVPKQAADVVRWHGVA